MGRFDCNCMTKDSCKNLLLCPLIELFDFVVYC